MLFTALALSLILLMLNRFKVIKKWPYLLVGLIMWFCVVKSGVHATLVGIVVILLLLKVKSNDPKKDIKHLPLQKSPSRDLEHKIHPWIAYVILPLFALANAGVSFNEFSPSMIYSSLPIGIIAGLFIGKQLGIFGLSWLTIKLGLADLPFHCRLSHIYGVAILAGVGFTMSLFIGTLAFKGIELELVRLGVLAGSFLAGIYGYCWLRFIR